MSESKHLLPSPTLALSELKLEKMSFAAQNHVKPARHEKNLGSLLTNNSEQTLSHCGLEMITPGTISSQGGQSVLNTRAKNRYVGTWYMYKNESETRNPQPARNLHTNLKKYDWHAADDICGPAMS